MNAVAWRGLLVGAAALVAATGCGATLDVEVSPDEQPTTAPTEAAESGGSPEDASASPTPGGATATPGPDADASTPTPEVDALDGDADDEGFVLPPLSEVGQCFTADQLGLVGADATSCEEPHVAEVFATTFREEPTGAPWPTLSVLQTDASVFCNRAFGELTGVPGDISAVEVKFFRPDEESWARDDREVACFVEYPEPVSVGLNELDPLRAFGRVSSYGLADGDCVVDETLTDVVSLTLANCDQAHTYEVYASLVLDDEAYPGEDAILSLADDFCNEEFERFVGIAYPQSVFLVENLWPTEQSWENWGDRLVTCAITTNTPRSSSAEGSGI